MDREQFIAKYMGGREYRVEGERVYWGDEGRYRCALPCQCGEALCDGWAMVSPEGRGWHLFKDGPDEGRPSYEDAIAVDAAWMQANPLGQRRSST